MEKSLHDQGFQLIAGVDEVGRGAWAGPLVVAAVIMPRQRIAGVADSKKLTPSTRERLFPKIIESAVGWSVVSVTQQEIDEIGVHNADIFALSYALTHLNRTPDIALVDGFEIEHYINTLRVVGGDEKSYNIGCASIIAKVVRDQFMCWADRVDGRYQFAQHKGYGTALHRQQLERYGPSLWHRQSFAPIQRLIYN